MNQDPHLGEMVSLDPSMNSAGVALFRAGTLVASTAVRMKPRDGELPAARCVRMAIEVVSWLMTHRARPRVLAVEWPGKSWRGDARDLHGLCGVNGAVAGILQVGLAQADIALEIVSFEPAEWSHGTKKSKTVAGAKKSPRARLILRALTREGEAGVWEQVKYNDDVDAIGIGLHTLGRLEPRVYPGAV